MYLTSHFRIAAMASGNALETDVIAFNINTGMLGQKGARTIRKANYDLDRLTEENSKNPSLNSTLGCLKVVDTFRDARDASASSNADTGSAAAAIRAMPE